MEYLDYRKPQIFPECRTCEALNEVIAKASDFVSATPDLLEVRSFAEIIVDCFPTLHPNAQNSVNRWLEPSLEITGARDQEEHVLPDMRIYTSCPGMIAEKEKRSVANRK